VCFKNIFKFYIFFFLEKKKEKKYIKFKYILKTHIYVCLKSLNLIKTRIALGFFFHNTQIYYIHIKQNLYEYSNH